MDRALFGLLIILSGVMFLFTDIGEVLINFASFFGILLCISIMFRSFKSRSMSTLVVVGIVLYYLLAMHIDLPTVSLLTLFMFFLFMSIGLKILFPSKLNTFIFTEQDSVNKFNINNQKTSFMKRVVYLTPDGISTENISSNMGYLKVYVNETLSTGNTLTIDMDVNASNVEIYVPTNYNIESTLNGYSSNLNIVKNASFNNDNILIVNGKVTMSNIEVRYIN